MIEQLINFPQSSPGWDLIKQLYNYYGLRDYARGRYYENFRPEKINRIYAYDKTNKIGEYIFWNKITNSTLNIGDWVSLENFQISPWFPRKPGLYWQPEARLAREKAYKHNVKRIEGNYVVFDVLGKILMNELGGIGSVNISKNREYVLFTATSSGHTERGIPIISSKKIWNDIANSIKKDKQVELDLQGEIIDIPLQFNSYFLRTPGLPRVAVLINSILNLNLKISDVNIWVTPWTIFETENKDMPYGFTYITHNLIKDDMLDSIEWIREYVYKEKGKTILTDFDEELNSLAAYFPLELSSDFATTSKNILSYCQKIARDFRIFQN